MAKFIGSAVTVPPPVAPAVVTDFNQLLQFRMATMKWAGDVMREIVTNLGQLDNAISAADIRDPNLQGATGNEVTARNALKDLGLVVKDRAANIIDTLLSKVEDVVVTPPTIDINNLVSIIETAIEKELDENNPLSVYALREVARSYVASILLDSAFDVVSSELTEITTTVDNFKLNRKSQIDTDLFIVERRTINELATDSVLDSDIASTTIARLNTRKDRLYAEVDAKAEELRQQLRNDARQRVFQKIQLRIQAIGLLPFNLPSGFVDVLGGVILRQFADPSAFIGQLPNILEFGVGSLSRLAEFMQRDRIEVYEGDVQQLSGYAQLLNVVAGNMAGVAEAVAKFATMEAS